MKVRVVNQPTGLLNGQPWPEAGETVDLPDVVAESMAAAGTVEVVKAEKKPAAKKAAAKPDKAEKRPAAKADVETRAKKK